MHATAAAQIDLERLAGPLAEIVRSAGAIGARFFRGGAERWTKADDSPVTEADIAVDRFLGAELSALVPQAAWLSEETADSPARLERSLVWIVDPIDGTRAFIEGKPEWVVSVALVESGRPIAGLVFNPMTDVMHAAMRDAGATRDGERLTAVDSDTLEGLKIGCPASLFGPLHDRGAAHARWHYALANRLVKVADGDLDGAVARPNAHDWDIAAAHVILEEAGARLIGFDGEAPTYNRPTTRHGGLLAAAPGRSALIHAALAEARASSPAEQLP